MNNKLTLVLVIGILLLNQSSSAQTWGAGKRLTWTTGHSWYPKVAADSNNHIHLVWIEFYSSWRDVGYKKSTDGGTTWTTKRLTWSPFSDYPVIAIDSKNHLHVVYQRYGYSPDPNREICYKRSTDGGTTWTTKRLTWNPTLSLDPAIAIDSNDHLHVVYWDYPHGFYEIYYKKSTDGGSTWTSKRVTWDNKVTKDPVIAADSNDHLHVVWSGRFSLGIEEIFYKKSTDAGATWGSTQRLTWNSGDSWEPAITVDANNHIHVVWEDYTPGDPKIFYKKSTDGGVTWSAKRLTWGSGWKWQSAITSDSNNHIHVVWTNYVPSYIEIYYRRSVDGGTTWGSVQRLTWNSGDSQYSDVAVGANNNIHVVWYDGTPTVYEIYYKKGIQ